MIIGKSRFEEKRLKFSAIILSIMNETDYITIENALKKGSGKVGLRGWVYRERKSN